MVCLLGLWYELKLGRKVAKCPSIRDLPELQETTRQSQEAQAAGDCPGSFSALTGRWGLFCLQWSHQQGNPAKADEP
jgi:hypothetical protein